MSLLSVPRIAKWPFLLGDALMVGLAYFIYTQANLPFNGPTLTASIACIGIGAALAVSPFILDYRAQIRLAEADGLASSVEQIRGLEAISTAVANATGQWQRVHEHATEAVVAARQVSDKMSAEMKSFVEFFEKANDSERQHLALEVDKLKRAESDWLGVLVRILDHVFAIHSAARRAGQLKILEQLTQFQLACRDAARRVGLSPLEAEAGTTFDPELHQLSSDGEVPEGSLVADTVATGFTFRGQVIRPIIVSLQSTAPSESPEGAPSEAGGPA